MAEQTVDLRSTLGILRRHLLVLTAVGFLGVGAGATLAWTQPPEYSSSSLVLLPTVQDSSGQSVPSNIQTDIKVATSGVVLAPAGANLDPAMTPVELAEYVDVVASTENVLEIVGVGETAGAAQARARAVAEAQVAYTEEAQSSLSSAEQAALDERRSTLQAKLDTVNRQVEATEDRLEDESPATELGRADASALAQLTVQQADLALQIDRLDDQGELQSDVASARIIQDASSARRTGMVAHVAVFAAGGLVTSLLLAVLVLAVVGRHDRRVRYRDEMADALGSPVLASVGSSVPRSAAGWTSLLQSYDPGTVDAWAMRQVLRGLVGGSDGGSERRQTGRTTKGERGRQESTVLVIALSNDPRGLAVAPQLASYAASVGVRTRLHAAQRHESAAVLWAACHRGSGQQEVRPGLFVDTGSTDVRKPELTVVMAVVDRGDPVLSVSPDVDRALLTVSSGSVTAEDIARAAVAADDAGSVITGLVVADPDDMDRTTGRMLQHERAQQVSLPARVGSVPAPGAPAGIGGPG